MFKLYKITFYFGSICFLLAIASCSYRYQMAKSYKYESGRKQMIQLKNVGLKIFLYPNDQYEKSFNVICSFQDVEKGKHLKLLAFKVGFINLRTNDTAIILNPVAFNSRTLKEARGRTDLIRAGELPYKVYDLNENMIYSFSYLFSERNLDQPVTKIKIHIEAELDDGGKIETIDNMYPFEKKSYLNISGN